MKKIFLKIITFELILLGLVYISPVKAVNSIGVSPASLSINYLRPGLKATKQVVISRADMTTDETFLIETDNSEISSWITILPSNKIIMTQDHNRSTLNIEINVPQDAELNSYKGSIYITKLNESQNAGVNLQTGVLIKLEFTVTDSDFVDLRIISAKIDDIKMGDNLKLVLTTVNDGNIDSAPSKVIVKIKSVGGSEISTLESTKIDTVPAFSQKDLEISLQGSNLPIDQYLADLEVLGPDSKTIYKASLSFKVTEQSGIVQSKFFTELLSQTWFIILLICVGVAFILLALFNIRRKKK